MSAVPNTVARVGASMPVGKTQWVERRASRLAAAYGLGALDAVREAENDYWAFRGVNGLCDQCDTTPVCSRPGCVPLTPRAPTPSAAAAGAVATRWIWRLLLAAAAILALLSLELRP